MKLFSRSKQGVMIPGEGNPQNEPTSPLPANTPAPDFSLDSSTGKTITLREYRGQPVILAFYPADGTPVCSDQLTLYNEVLPLFEEYNAQLFGISVDSLESHQAFSAERNLSFPLLADFEPRGAVSRAYGVYDSKDETSQRALFVINSSGVISWSYLSPSKVNPGANGILEALEALDE